MKTVRKLFWILAAVVLPSCGSDSEEELVGNWVRLGMGDFSGPARAYSAYFVIGDYGYVCGGYNGYKTPRSDMWRYNATTQVAGWTQVDSLPTVERTAANGVLEQVGRQRAVGFSLNGKGYVGTGWDGDELVMKDFFEYNPALDGQRNSDNTSKAWQEIAPLPGPARYDAIAFVINGTAYVGGGYTSGVDKEYLADVYKFIPPTAAKQEGGWEAVPPMGKKRGGAVAFVLRDPADNKEYAYVCTGQNSSGNVYEFQRFDGEKWENLRHMKSWADDDDFDDEYGNNLMRINAIAFTMKGSGSVEKGYITAGNVATTWEYDPPVYDGNRNVISGDIWVQRTPFSSSRMGAFALSFPGKGANGDNLVVIGTGTQGSYFRDDILRFEPEAENSTSDD
ncbi:MAG: hypothetical protein LBR08_08670 [Bacteroidales bacterium]|jgi:hypothetical protein|nr:hypothetical protein [Bacteroidales bacterium]